MPWPKTLDVTSGAILGLSEPGGMRCVCVCVHSGAQERVGNGKVVSVGGRCGCEMKSCPFFFFCITAHFPPSFPLSPLFLTGFALMARNGTKALVAKYLNDIRSDSLMSV